MCTSYNFRQSAIFVPKINYHSLRRSYDKNNFACFLRHGVARVDYSACCKILHIERNNVLVDCQLNIFMFT